MMIRFVVVPESGPTRNYTVKKSRLASASKMFEELLCFLPPEPQEEIVIKEFSPKAFKAMLRYIHEKPVMLDGWELALELLRLAEFYQILGLQDWCLKYIRTKKIKPSEVIRVYDIATEMDVPEVQCNCIAVVKQGQDEVIHSPDFEVAKPRTVRAILDCCDPLGYRSVLAVVKWSQRECGRRGISCTPKNVKKCIGEVCKQSMSGELGVIISKLGNVKQMKSNPSMALKSTKKKKKRNNNSNYRCLVPLPCKASLSNHAIDLPLTHVPSDAYKMQSVFKTDIICEIKISVLQGALDLIGMILQLKPKMSANRNTSESLEVCYSVTRQSEYSCQFSEKAIWDSGECCEIRFDRVLRVWKERCAVVKVRIEDLEPCRCLAVPNESQEVSDTVKGINLALEFRSNQTTLGSSNAIPFFIERIFYRE